VHAGNLIRSEIVPLDDWIALWGNFEVSRRCKKFWEMPRIWHTAWRHVLVAKLQLGTNNSGLVVLCPSLGNLLGGLSGTSKVNIGKSWTSDVLYILCNKHDWGFWAIRCGMRWLLKEISAGWLILAYCNGWSRF